MYILGRFLLKRLKIGERVMKKIETFEKLLIPEQAFNVHVAKQLFVQVHIDRVLN